MKAGGGQHQAGEAGPAIARGRAGFGDVSASQKTLRQQAGAQSRSGPVCGEPLLREAGTCALIPPKLLQHDRGPLTFSGLHFPGRDTRLV